MKAFDYAIAKNEKGAVEALSKGYRAKGAGIDLLDMLKERTERGDRFVSLHKVDSLSYIKKEGNGVEIGAMTTLQEIGDSKEIKTAYPALAHAAGEAATPQVRARASVAGNLLQRPRCWYFRAKEYPCLKKGGSTCFAVEGENSYHAIFGGGPCHIIHPSNVAPALVAVDAEIHLQKKDSERVVKAEDFFVTPDKSMYAENTLEDGELLSKIVIPKFPEKSGYIEFREKQSFDWPLASAVAVYMNGKWSVILNHVAPVPWRSLRAEKVLGTNADISEEKAEEAALAAIKDAMPMSDNAYRVRIAKAAVRRAVRQACGKETV